MEGKSRVSGSVMQICAIVNDPKAKRSIYCSTVNNDAENNNNFILLLFIFAAIIIVHNLFEL